MKAALAQLAKDGVLGKHSARHAQAARCTRASPAPAREVPSPVSPSVELTSSADSGDVRDWAKIEKESLAFAEKKKSEGRFDAWNGKAPTYDLTQKRETVK